MFIVHYQKKLLLYLFVPMLLTGMSLKVAAQTDLVPKDSLPGTVYLYNKTDEYKAHLNDIAQRDAAPLDKKIQAQYLGIINDKNKDLINRLNGKEFLFDTVVYPYLYSIFRNIIVVNDLKIDSFHFFVSRSLEVNAYTYEDGTVVCNLGLLNILDNEGELAMVFSHEISHYLLKHSNTELIKYLDNLNSDELLAKLKDIQKTGYDTKRQMEDLQMADVFNRTKHSRSQEAAADSLGMILYSKTHYNGNAVPRLFELFDSCESNETPVCTIEAFCGQENIASNDSWFKTPKKMSFSAAPEKEIVDSLRTHPDCPKRELAARLFFEQHPKPGADFVVADHVQLTRIKNIALFDEANYEKNANNLGGYLYLLIQNDAQFPANPYIKTELFNTLLAISIAEKSHQLYSVVHKPIIPNGDKDEYAKLLKIIDEISLTQLIEITSNYYDKNKDLIHTTNDSIDHLNQLKKQL
jgi:Peptidase family M48